jgi:Flp pilus assembly protein TadB
MSSRISLVLALAALVLWGILAFAVRVEAGVVHLLLAAGVVLLVRWWALRPKAKQEK